MYKSKFTGPEVDEAIERVLNEETFNKSGRYPEMSVGFSDDLVGRGESVPAEFSFRASGGKSIKDGAARIKRLKGNSVVWNQWAKSFEEAYEKPYHNEGITYNGNKVTIDNWRSYQPFRFDIKCSTAKDHLYLVLLNYANTNPDQLIYIEFGGENSIYKNIGNIAYFHRNIIYNNEHKDAFALYLAYTLEGTITLSDLQVIDLTKMFGAGNEPTTIEEYKARKPIVADEYAYNEGEVIHMTAEGIKSVGDNAWDEQWELGYINPGNGNESDSSSYIRSKNYCRIIGGEEYYLKQTTGGDGTDANMFIVLYDENHSYLDYWGIPESGRTIQFDSRAQYFKVSFRDTYGTTYKNDVMISLVHSGWKQDTDAGYQPYWEDRLMLDKRIKDEFPNGMSKWDAVYNKNGKGYIVHGLGVEDMGDMNWGYDNQNGNMVFISWDISGLVKKPSDAETNKGAISAKYSASSSLIARDMGNMTWLFKNDGAICIDNETYNDAESFKAAMAGVPLYYQLAEPVVIEYDEPFNLDYRVADFGTEEIIAPQPSAPISADIIYQFNAVDMIREHELEITELQRIIATMQAQLISLTSNNGGQ